MPTQQRSLTWVVIEDGKIQRALCVQASSPSRVRKFMRAKGNFWAVERGYGEDHNGKRLEGENRRRLARRLQRHAEGPGAQAVAEILTIRAHVDDLLARIASQAGIAREVLARPSRSPQIYNARVRAAHDLRHRLDLPLSDIAEALHLKDHSAVRYLLKKPYPDPEEVSCSPSAA